MKIRSIALLSLAAITFIVVASSQPSIQRRSTMKSNVKNDVTEMNPTLYMPIHHYKGSVVDKVIGTDQYDGFMIKNAGTIYSYDRGTLDAGNFNPVAPTWTPTE